MAALEPGDPQEIGGYRLLGRLGEGGMGMVYLGLSAGGRRVAIKIVHEHFAGDREFRARFRREVTTARAVSGAFTAPVIDADPDAAAPWLVTTFLDGRPLNDVVDEHGPLPPGAVASLGAGLAEALISIHAAGIVHRDLKPHNVMLTPDGPRVIDFGIAHAAGISAITMAGSVIGSPGYMPPEQARGHETGPPGDVFSLGAVLTFAATGTGPFGRGLLQVMVYRVVHEDPCLDAVPDPRLRSLIAACLDKDPARRPAPRDLLQRLGAAPHGVTWLPPSMAAEIAQSATLAPGRRRIGRRTILLGAAYTAALIVGGTGAGLIGAHAAGKDVVPGDGPEEVSIQPSARGAASGREVRSLGFDSRPSDPAFVPGLMIVGTDAGKMHAFETGKYAQRWVWRFELEAVHALGSRPAVSGDLAFAVDVEGRVHAVDVHTGDRKWHKRLGTGGGTPVVAGGLLHLRTGTPAASPPNLVVFDATGARRGTLDGVASDPVTDGRSVFVAVKDGVAVLDGGRERPEAKIPIRGADALALSGTVLYGADHGAGHVWAFELSTRRTLWTYRLVRGRPQLLAGLAAAGERVFAVDRDGNLLGIWAVQGTPDVRWTFATGQIPTTPVAANGAVYLHAGRYLHAVDAATGKARYRDDTGGEGSVTAAGGLVYVRGPDSALGVLRG